MGCFGKINNSCLDVVNKLKEKINKNFLKDIYCPKNFTFLDATGTGIIDYCEIIKTENIKIPEKTIVKKPLICSYSDKLLIKDLFKKIFQSVNLCENKIKTLLKQCIPNIVQDTYDFLTLNNLDEISKKYNIDISNFSKNSVNLFFINNKNKLVYFLNTLKIVPINKINKIIKVDKNFKTNTNTYIGFFYKNNFYSMINECYILDIPNNISLSSKINFYDAQNKQIEFLGVANILDTGIVSSSPYYSNDEEKEAPICPYPIYDEKNDVFYNYFDKMQGYAKFIRCNKNSNFETFDVKIKESSDG